MKIVEVSIKDIIPYENNPRIISQEAIDKVANSIKEFGFQQPIVVDKNMVIVAGHTRYKACEALRIGTVPVVIADNLTEEQVRAYRLADNKTNEFARWDDTLLDFELSSIFDINMTDFGFSLDENFIDEDVDTEDKSKEFTPKEQEMCTCPNCGLQFVPIRGTSNNG